LYQFEQLMISEMQHVSFLRLEGDEGDYFDGRKPSWGDSFTRFPLIREEAIQGGKAYAVGLYPACAFHMMRILEIALNTLAEELGVTFEHRNWQNILNDLEAAVREIDKSHDPHKKAKSHFYSGVALHFFFLKDAWRNYAMHVKEPWDQGRALSVMNHVSELTRALALDRPWDQRS
jgi:hypothetical protein